MRKIIKKMKKTKVCRNNYKVTWSNQCCSALSNGLNFHAIFDFTAVQYYISQQTNLIYRCAKFKHWQVH